MFIWLIGHPKCRCRRSRGDTCLDPHDARHAGNNLHEDRRCHCFCISVTVPVNTQMVDDRSVPSEIASRCTKRFREGAHQDINPSWRYVVIISDATAMGSKSPNRMRFVDKQIELNTYRSAPSIKTAGGHYTLYFSFNLISSGRLGNVPSILKSPSTITRIFFQGLWVFG